MFHKYHVKRTIKQCNLDRLKIGSKNGTNKILFVCLYSTLAFFFPGFESTLVARQVQQERTQMEVQ